MKLSLKKQKILKENQEKRNLIRNEKDHDILARAAYEDLLIKDEAIIQEAINETGSDRSDMVRCETTQVRTRATKTAASLATVPILDQLRDYLIQIRKKTGLVVPGPDGKLLNNQQQARMFKEWTEENGLGFTLHQLRHFFATALWEADVPADEAQILLRHSSLRMTMDVYRDLEIAKTKQQRIFERAKTISF